jgi:membrane protein DedA with SNARE-associated domain
MNELVRQTVAFVQDHQGWAAPLLFALAFGESFAFIAVWVPFVSILLAVGAVLGASGLSIWPALLGAILGAFAAQWLAYEMAFRLKGRVMRFWPLSRQEALVVRGVAFFRRRGLPAVFVGRFFGPLRAVTPFAAGLCEMPRARFQIANLASAIVWSAGMLAPGVLGMNWLLGA